MKIRLGLVSPFPPPFGGMSVLANTMKECLMRQSIDVTEIHTHPFAGKEAGRGHFIGKIMQTLFFYRNMLRILKVDAVLVIASSGAYFFIKVIPVLLFCKMMKKPVAIDVVGGAFEDKIKNGNLIWRIIFSTFDSVIVPTRYFRDILEKERIRAVVVPHVVDIARFRIRSSKPSVPVFLAIKHLSDISGIDTIILAFNEIKKRYPDAELYIAGEGPLKDSLLKLADSLGLEDVRFLGNVHYDDIPGLYERASVFVHGTKYESFGMVLIEAFASGTPVVSTNVGGIPDLITDGFDGYLVSYKDYRAMADRMIQLVENETLYESFQKNGLRKSLEYSCEVIGPVLSRHIHALIR